MIRKTLTRLAGLIALAALVGGCAAGGAPKASTPLGQEPLDEVRALAAELGQQEQALAALQAGPEPDCGRVRMLVENICRLAKRICDIAERHPDQADLGLRCQDARPRCERAGQLLADKCPAAP